MVITDLFKKKSLRNWEFQLSRVKLQCRKSKGIYLCSSYQKVQEINDLRNRDSLFSVVPR